MNSTEIRSILRSPYNREDWKNLYRNIFQNKVTFHEEPHQYNVNEDIVESLYQIGYATLDDEYIVALFEVNIKSDVNLLSKKIGLRKIISKYISDDKFNGILTIFENGTPDYRFTFASKTTKITEEGIEVVETESKRFTYILGENEPCLTPTQRFESLFKKNGKINLEDIKEAFSVDKLNKEFFNGYKEHYESLCNYFYTNPLKKKIFNDDDKLVRDFVKKFLGRIVFLYFVQKKGWLGVKPGEIWGSGDHLFLSNLYKSYKNKNQFYDKIISKIFFDYLSVERLNDIVCLYDDKFYRIPYLNGGLFEKEEVDEFEINFEEFYLESLFSFFDRFNFTIYEDDPNEHTVAVDPEMLGHIFENLLEDNKDKGAFYTPKEIVHYMCQESLIEYLTTWFENKGYEIVGYSSFNKPEQPVLFSENEGRKGQLVLENKLSNKSKIIDRVLIENLLKKRLTDNDKNLILDHADEFHIALNKVKICDPAIGSGAFPMGLLQEIFISKQTLWNFEHGNLNDFPASDVKLNIIQNSIYGVDIEKGAVDVARLRFWLSLIVDEEEPKSLPNLDYKIVVGNSLVSTFEGEVVEIDWNIKFNNVDSVNKLILNQQNKLYQLEHSQHLFFQSYTNKEVLKKQIKCLKIEIIENQLLLSKISFTDNNPILGGFDPSADEIEINEINKLYIKKLGSLLKKLDEIKNNDRLTLNYFDWRLNFPEVLNSKISTNSGFDILIANPPYIGEKGNKEIFHSVKQTSLSKFYLRKMDYFYFFFHQALNITNKNSFISFITTNYYVTATGAVKLRKDIKSRASIYKLVNFGESKVFPSAIGQHNLITFLTKKINLLHTSVLSVHKNGLINSSDYERIFNIQDSNTSYSKIDLKDLYTGEENYIRIVTSGNKTEDDSVNQILNKIEVKGELLGNICEVNQGLRTGADKVSPKHIVDYGVNINYQVGDGIFFLTKDELEHLKFNTFEKNRIKKLYKNSDISKYVVNETTNLRLIDLFYPNDRNLDKDKIPNIIKHLFKFKSILEGRKENANGIDKAIIRGEFYYGSVRRKLDFSIPKIIAPQRSKSNTFAYTEKEWFASADVYYITDISKKQDLKYILGLLNSKLYLKWLIHRGKTKGSMLELYQKPLSEVPIITNKNTKVISSIVDELIREKIKGNSITKLENKIDNLVYKLYELTYDEVLIVDSNFSLSRKDYEHLQYK